MGNGRWRCISCTSDTLKKAGMEALEGREEGGGPERKRRGKETEEGGKGALVLSSGELPCRKETDFVRNSPLKHSQIARLQEEKEAYLNVHREADGGIRHGEQGPEQPQRAPPGNAYFSKIVYFP